MKYCYRCYQDHSEPLKRWCDRSDLEIENESLRMKLNKCAYDYDFMINIIEKYGTDKDQTLKDCLERMKFRKPMFKTMKEEK